MESPEQDARDRLSQSQKRFVEFGEEFTKYSEADSVVIEKSLREEAGKSYAVFAFRVKEPIPNDLRLTFGESLAQLRNALDNVTVSLALKYKLAKAEKSSFPVFRNEDSQDGGPSFNRWKKSYPFPEDVEKVFSLFQPYKRCTSPNDREFVDETHPLYVLNKLSQIDKHRMPLQICATLPSASVNMMGMNLEGQAIGGTATVSGGVRVLNDGEWTDISSSEIYAGQIITDGVEYAKVLVTKFQPYESIQVPVTLRINIGEDSPVARKAEVWELYQTLYGLTASALSVLVQAYEDAD